MAMITFLLVDKEYPFIDLIKNKFLFHKKKKSQINNFSQFLTLSPFFQKQKVIYQKLSFSTKKDLEFDVNFWIVSVWLEKRKFSIPISTNIPF